MSEHYYTGKPTAAHDRRKFAFRLAGREFVFMSDAGVFSREAVDFGSRLLIGQLRLPADAKVLDVGCGYGPIGLAAASMAPLGSATLLDVNERAVELAAENARANGLGNVRVLVSDGYAAVAGETFTHILTNPPIRAGKAVVHRIFEEAREHLVAGGELWVVIQKKQGAPSAWGKLEACYGNVEEVAKDKGYRIFRAVK